MRVLLVEDEAAIARDVASALAETGYVVDMARDGEEGWFRASGDSSTRCCCSPARTHASPSSIIASGATR